MNNMTSDGPDAPWNEEERPLKTVGVTISITMSKYMEIEVNDYIADCNGKDIHDTNCYLRNAVDDAVVFPHELSRYIRGFFKYNPEFKNMKIPGHLEKVIEECDDWTVDDMEIIRE